MRSNVFPRRATRRSFTAAIGLVLALCFAHGIGCQQGWSSLFPQDTVGGKISAGHANQTRWTEPGRSGSPRLAFVWFPSDEQVAEVEVFTNRFKLVRSTKVLNESGTRVDLDQEAMEKAESLLQKLPAGQDKTEFASQLRISWSAAGTWQSRIYDRADLPPEVVDLALCLDINLEPICPVITGGVPVYVVGYNPPELRVAACDAGPLVLCAGRLMLIDYKDPQRPRFFPTPPNISNRVDNALYNMSATPDASRVAFSTERAVTVHDLASGRELWRRSMPAPFGVVEASLSPDGGKLLVNVNRTLTLFSLSGDFEPRVLVSPTEDRVKDMAWSKDGKHLAWADENKVTLCDERGNLTYAITNSSTLTSLAFAPDGKKLALLFSEIMRVDLCEVQNGKLSRAISIGVGQTYPPEHVAWSADSRKLALHGMASPIILCDITKGRPVALINANLARPVVFSGQDRVLLAVGNDARIHRWDLTGLNR